MEILIPIGFIIFFAVICILPILEKINENIVKNRVHIEKEIVEEAVVEEKLIYEDLVDEDLSYELILSFMKCLKFKLESEIGGYFRGELSESDVNNCIELVDILKAKAIEITLLRICDEGISLEDGVQLSDKEIDRINEITNETVKTTINNKIQELLNEFKKLNNGV